MNRLFAINRLRWHMRLPIKWAVFGLTLLIVCFPYPTRLVNHVKHWRNPNALIEPDAPAIQPLVEELRPLLGGDLTPRQTLSRVERFVYEKIPYEWDWVTWGTADYLPTVDEVLQMGKEDCDGRAVVAASILQNLGYEAELVTNFAHMWVKTDHGETMAPGKRKALTATDKGWRVDFKALIDLPRSLAFGIAVFPLSRELIVLFVMWLLMLRPGSGTVVGWCSILLLFVGLILLRIGSDSYQHPRIWIQGVALTGLLAAVVIMLFCGRYRARHGVGVGSEAMVGDESG